MILLGHPTGPDDGSLQSAVSEFFFPRYLGGRTWVNLRERCYPSFLDAIYDLVPEEQRFICMNQWVYQHSYSNHLETDAANSASDDTMGLKDRYVTVLSKIYERARDHGGFIESGWIMELLQTHLTELVDFMVQKFPTGPHFYTGHVNYDRLASNS